MKIVITGGVGTGKSTIAKELSKILKFELIDLSNIAQKYHIENNLKLQTFDFDIDKLILDIEDQIKINTKSLILESHFSHFINEKYVDLLIVLSRDLQDLKEEYLNRGYNKQKITDNLEVESFNVCFYEAEENGYPPEKILYIDNKDKQKTISKILSKIEKLN